MRSSSHFTILPDVLRAVAGAEQKRVGGFHDDEIVDANRGDKLLRAPEKISARVQRERRTGGNVLAFGVREQFVDRGPRADVAPADFRGNHEDARRWPLSRVARSMIA